MSEVLFRYRSLDPTSWAYLASLLTLAVYFKFNRFWSLRNSDIVGLILIAPPLLLVKYGLDHGASVEHADVVEHIGYIWLFVVNVLFMLRLMLDATMVRRPLLEPNLTTGGLAFLGASLFAFLTANIIFGAPDQAGLSASQRAAHLRDRSASAAEPDSLTTHGPGFPLLYLLPHISTQTLLGAEAEREAPLASEIEEPNAAEPTSQSAESEPEAEPRASAPVEQKQRTIRYVHVVTARVVAILSQLAIIIGMVLIGMRHFDNVKTGIAAATLYLLLPYTAMWSGDVTHSLPGALVVAAVLLYRRPLLAGSMVGLACGTIYYPVFLLPLWISFYWRRGLRNFLIGILAMVGLLVAVLALTSTDAAMFLAHLRQMFGVRFPLGADSDLSGAWKFWQSIYRLPILWAFVLLSLSFVLWPAQKNLGTLIAYSAAVMLGTQFWHAHSGGLALAWCLPLLILTMFRPNLEDRLAPAVVR